MCYFYRGDTPRIIYANKKWQYYIIVFLRLKIMFDLYYFIGFSIDITQQLERIKSY